jgi:hypothetical protein
MGVTIINARLLLDRDGHLTITLPHEVHAMRATSRAHSRERLLRAQTFASVRYGSIQVRYEPTKSRAASRTSVAARWMSPAGVWT